MKGRSILPAIRSAVAIAALAVTAAADAASVLFIATNNVPPGKFHLLAKVAKSHGISVEVRYADKLPADSDDSLFKGRDAVFFDTYLQDYVRGKLAHALPGLKAPHVWLYEASPAWGGMPEATARRLLAYYVNGSRANFDGFFATLAAQLAGRPATGIADPIVFPKSAVYHPRAPGLVFADPAAYLRWKGVEPSRRPPTVALFLHQQYIASEQTAFIDDLIARIEAAGALPLPVYAPAMDNGTLAAMLHLDGNLQSVSQNLTLAFSAVILALISASLTYGLLSLKRRWSAEELESVRIARQEHASPPEPRALLATEQENLEGAAA